MSKLYRKTVPSVIQQLEYNAKMARAMEEWSGSLDWSTRLKNDGVLSGWFLTQAFKRVHRGDFLPPDHAKEEGYNGPIPIGHGQFNSQPLIVAIMLEALNPRPGELALDFGAGSGWTTALMAAVVKRRGRVTGTEIVPELVEFGNDNLAKYRLSGAHIIHTPDELGYPEGGPYDKILVSARLPEDWLPELTDQLNPDGGRLIAPISSMADFETGNTQRLIAITRHGSSFRRKDLEQPVAFVPTIRHESG